MCDGAMACLEPHADPIATERTETVGHKLQGGGLLGTAQPPAHRNHFLWNHHTVQILYEKKGEML